MGIIVLIVSFVTKAAVVAYCMTTQSNKRKLKGFIRVGSFAAFILAGVAPLPAGVITGRALIGGPVTALCPWFVPAIR